MPSLIEDILMAAKQSMIAVRPERAQQLQAMAEASGLSKSEFIESLISKQARSDKIRFPGLIVNYTLKDNNVFFGFKVGQDGESLPATELTTDEARLLAMRLKKAAEKPCTLFAGFISEKEGILFDVNKKGVAVTLDAFMPNKKHYRKTMSRIMAVDVADWLVAAAKEAESHK